MAAATVPTMTVEEYIAQYLGSGEKPAYEYLDGLLIRKPTPSREHSHVQAKITFFLRLHYGALVNPPDLAIEERSNPIKGNYPGPNHPVYLCVEIKSPTDRIPTLWAKCVDYHAWGVPYCWVIDPERRLAWEYTPADDEPRRVADSLTAGEIQIPLASVFEGVDPAS